MMLKNKRNLSILATALVVSAVGANANAQYEVFANKGAKLEAGKTGGNASIQLSQFNWKIEGLGSGSVKGKLGALVTVDVPISKPGDKHQLFVGGWYSSDKQDVKVSGTKVGDVKTDWFDLHVGMPVGECGAVSVGYLSAKVKANSGSSTLDTTAAWYNVHYTHNFETTGPVHVSGSVGYQFKSKSDVKSNYDLGATIRYGVKPNIDVVGTIWYFPQDGGSVSRYGLGLSFGF